MSLVGRIWQGISNSGVANPAPWLIESLGGGLATAGLPINPHTAMSISAVFACIRNLAEDVAKLPLAPYRKLKPRGKEMADDSPLYRVLHDQANPEMTAFDFRQCMMVQSLLWGRACAEIEWTGRGRVAALWPIEPWRIRPQRDAKTSRLYFEVDGGALKLPMDSVLHLKGLSANGIVGYMLPHVGKESWALAAAAERFGASFFGNGANAGVVLTHPGRLGKTARDNLRDGWNEAFQGSGNAHKTAVLDEGVKVEKTTYAPEESQFIETRQFQIEEVCRWFRMPPHKIQHLLRSTNNNIEHQSIEYVIDTLLSWLVRWEQECNSKLVLEPGLFVEHKITGLLRGDTASRFDAYGKAIQSGWMSRNDVRELENMNPVEGGDVYLVPANMIASTAIETRPVSDREKPQGQPSSEEKIMEFKREAWLGFQRSGTVTNVMANLSGLKSLTKDVGIATNDEYTEPYLPVIAPAGQLVSGATIQDPQGDIVGGDVENDLPDDSGGRNASSGGDAGSAGAGTDPKDPPEA